MNKIIDPGHHWHKDDMEDEDPRPSITEPDYDEHSDNRSAFYERMNQKYEWDLGDPQDYPGWEDVPF